MTIFRISKKTMMHLVLLTPLLAPLGVHAKPADPTAGTGPHSRSPGIAWRTCTQQIQSDLTNSVPELVARTQCGVIRVPLDYDDPAKGDIDVAVRRVRAKDPAQREGVLFVNAGGPGGTGQDFALALDASWGSLDPGNPDNIGKIHLSERYDVIGMDPRGVDITDAAGGKDSMDRGARSTGLHCRSSERFPVFKSLADDSSPQNLEATLQAAAVVRRGCQAQALAPYISTYQTVRDMDRIRQALGEPALNYLGYSYGTWLGAWYGATFPEHTRRMVLDSNVDWTAADAGGLLDIPPAIQADFERFVVARAAANPRVYGMGADPAAIRQRFMRLGPAARDFVRGLIYDYHFEHPETLMLASYADDQLKQHPGLSQDALAAAIAGHRFSPDTRVDAAAKAYAPSLFTYLFAPTPAPRPLHFNSTDSVGWATVCNDVAFAQSENDWIRTGMLYGRLYPVGTVNVSNGSDSRQFPYVPCMHWRRPTFQAPDMHRLSGIADLVMVQAQFDPATPLQTAWRAYAKTPRASMVYLQGGRTHGVFDADLLGGQSSRCVERAIGDFLADGVKPPRLLTCRYDPEPPATAASAAPANTTD